jgi:hypothetical protein
VSVGAAVAMFASAGVGLTLALSRFKTFVLSAFTRELLGFDDDALSLCSVTWRFSDWRHCCSSHRSVCPSCLPTTVVAQLSGSGWQICCFDGFCAVRFFAHSLCAAKRC